MSNITKLSGEVEYKKPSWLRVIEVRLYSRLTPDKIVYGNYQNPDNDYLNISIDGTKKLSSNQNTCTIKITNLTYEDILKITMGEFYGVEVWIGYRMGDVFKWFDGEVAYVSQKLNNHRDNEVTIFCASRLVAQFTQNRMKIALNSGINLFSAFKYISDRSDMGALPFNKSDLKNKFLDNAISAMDSPKALLDLIADQANLDIAADTSDGTIVDITSLSDKRQIKIDANTISFLNGNPTLNSAGLDIYLLPTFDFRVGDIIIIDHSIVNVGVNTLTDAQKNFNTNFFDTTLVGTGEQNRGLGMYIIKNIDFNFQNRGNNFSIHINGRAVSLLYGDV